MQLPQFGAYLL